jgi:ribosomal protein S18 acetylase RimI-like enzyme
MKKDVQLMAVKTWYLHFKGSVSAIAKEYSLERWNNPEIVAYLTLYQKVGDPWGWTGRLMLTTEALNQKLNSPANEVWLFSLGKNLLGFFEIDRSVQGKAEIVYFGLLPELVGKGHGKYFLDAAITTASGNNGDQVWLHTCEYDHHKALEIYKKAGFVIEKETIEQEYYPVNFIRSRT